MKTYPLPLPYPFNQVDKGLNLSLLVILTE